LAGSLARRTKNANQGQRLLALAEIYDGSSRSRAAQVGGVGRQIVRGSSGSTRAATMEQTHRAAQSHQIHRKPAMGKWIMINAGWY
jgi:hypothetical protein